MAEDKKIEAIEKVVVKCPWFWIRDVRGEGSVTVTLVFISFLVMTMAYILSIFSKIGNVEIRPFDVAACTAYFTPILTLYGARKFTDAKYGNGTSNGNGNGNGPKSVS